ncbi:MAG: VOC family protein [Campylobacterota bacterium]|nr:VOC family protein [Campylobacterota bacterium]
MLVDHIFIFVNSKEEADALVDFGMTEGSGNVHRGIGTVNRRFFFENFYLEILWVENESEAKSVSEIGIWERSNYKSSGYSRFGLCLKNRDDTDSIFENSIKWEPMFLSKGEYVNILTNEKMPWIFRFPVNRRKDLSEEPTFHKSGIEQLSKAIFNLSKKEFGDKLDLISDNSIIEFEKVGTNSLILEFDNKKQGKTKIFENLNLILNY